MVSIDDWDPEASTDETPIGEWRVLSGASSPGKEPYPDDASEE